MAPDFWWSSILRPMATEWQTALPLTMKKIRLLLVDDHSLFRESLSRLLEAEPGFVIAGTCATTAEALTLLASEAIDGKTIDVVLLDYDLGDEQGTVFIEESKRRG